MSDIRMIDKNTDLINSPHDDLQYDIMISNRLYNIARYPEYVHSINGNKNNCYWVWPRTEERKYYNMIPYNGHLGALWDFEINSLNYEDNDNYIYPIYRATIKRNNSIFDQRYYKYDNLAYITSITIVRMTKLKELPIGLNNKNFLNNLIKREILYRGNRAIVEDYDYEYGLKIILREDENGLKVPNNIAISMGLEEDEPLTIDILSDDIDWFPYIDEQ